MNLAKIKVSPISRNTRAIGDKKLAQASHTPASAALATIAGKEVADVLGELQTASHGLSENTASERLQAHGPNRVTQERQQTWIGRLFRALRNPLVILLSILAITSWVTGEARAACVMAAMLLVGVLLRFVQESRADLAANRLRSMIHVTATVVRDGKPREIALEELVPGDVVNLCAGDMIPADVRLISAKGLYCIESTLTGESLPVEKTCEVDHANVGNVLDFHNICFLGTSVERGSAVAVIVNTGKATILGQIAQRLDEEPPTSFDRGVAKFTWLMIGLMTVMVPAVFVLNVLTKHNWHQAFFFSLAIAVGLTPEMLPMIISTCLAKGALVMSQKKVIVKRLSAIQNLGAMDVLCADKTGTLTMDHVILERYCDVAGDDDEQVLLDAHLVSHFQSGLKSVLDRAVLDHRSLHAEWELEKYRKLDEIPFDFNRRVMSVVADLPDGKRRLLSKGAPESLFKCCTQFELKGEINPIGSLIDDLNDEYEQLSADGFRVLAVAYRDVPAKDAYDVADESELILRGYIAFLDPPKDTAATAIRALAADGLSLKILTGDNALVAAKICRDVKLSDQPMLLGADIEAMNDEQLATRVQDTQLFARLAPSHKERIIRALQRTGHVVGFLGDGINDAPALHAADVGISVDAAVDIAKASADVILLEKDLMVLHDGVLEGRKVFANILKYIRMGASSSFGNMFSVLGASAFLPFLPMAPLQVLTNNLLYDFSQAAIPTDLVDPEQIAKPQPWAIDRIRHFILLVGPISSIFDYTTFLIMLFVFKCWTSGDAPLFQTGWFVESVVTQTLIIHIIRTNRIPFLQSRSSWPLALSTIAIVCVAMWLPYSPLATTMGFVPLPAMYWPLLLLTAVCYLTLTHFIRRYLLRRRWI